MKTSEILQLINQLKPVNGHDNEKSYTRVSGQADEQPETDPIELEPQTPMITKVTTKPNPFYTSITLDVMCQQSKHTIVRMFDLDGRIVKMFGWYLIRGNNMTTINELNTLRGGTYFVDILDTEGTVLFGTRLTKE